jgi:hypothetical protein
MLVLSFFSWWYGRGWREIITGIGPRIQGIAASFSMGQLTRTLFAPWRRIITGPGTGLGGKLRAWGDNIVSRAVGFVVRLLVLFAGCLITLTVLVLSIIEVVVWPLLPLAVPALIVMGLL